MPKSKLKVDFSYEFTLFGVISTIKEHKLAWEINRATEVHLVKNEDVQIEFFNNTELIISNYIFETENSEFRLLKNKSVNTFRNSVLYLLPELNSFDYIILLNGFEDTFSTEEIKAKLQTVAGIQYLKEFNPSELKSKENLIF